MDQFANKHTTEDRLRDNTWTVHTTESIAPVFRTVQSAHIDPKRDELQFFGWNLDHTVASDTSHRVARLPLSSFESEPAVEFIESQSTLANGKMKIRDCHSLSIEDRLFIVNALHRYEQPDIGWELLEIGAGEPDLISTDLVEGTPSLTTNLVASSQLHQRLALKGFTHFEISTKASALVSVGKDDDRKSSHKGFIHIYPIDPDFAAESETAIDTLNTTFTESSPRSIAAKSSKPQFSGLTPTDTITCKGSITSVKYLPKQDLFLWAESDPREGPTLHMGRIVRSGGAATYKEHAALPLQKSIAEIAASSDGEVIALRTGGKVRSIIFCSITEDAQLHQITTLQPEKKWRQIRTIAFQPNTHDLYAAHRSEGAVAPPGFTAHRIDPQKGIIAAYGQEAKALRLPQTLLFDAKGTTLYAINSAGFVSSIKIGSLTEMKEQNPNGF